MYLIIIAHLPEENQQLLMEMHLLCRIRQVRLNQRIIQQARYAP